MLNRAGFKQFDPRIGGRVGGPARPCGLALAISGALALGVQTETLAQTFPNEIRLQNFDGSYGFVLNGEANDDASGTSVSAAGDINGDGIDDLIVGAPNADPYGSYSGRAYVVFGSDGGLPHPFDLDSINGLNGFVLNGESNFDYAGRSVSAAGDINGDGIDDLIIGASNAESNGIDSGRSYVVFGSDAGLPNPFNLSAINGLNGFVLNGEAAKDASGRSVAAAGDINGDGIDDLIIGAPNADSNHIDSGRSYVVFGSAAGLPNPFNLSAINGLNGFVLNGEAAEDESGSSVAAAGDINGDGIDDLIIGAPNADPNGNRSGRSYVVFGSATDLPNPFNLSTINGLNGFVLNGESESDRAGRSVSAAGDINGDGIDDLIIGAPGGGNPDQGRVYVVFGSTSAFGSPFNLADLDGINGFKITGKMGGDRFGISVSAAGDINGDGIDDLITGADRVSSIVGADLGESYVVFGSMADFSTNGSVISLSGSRGFRISGDAEGDRSGYSVSGAGDINGDGIDDVIIGALRADPNGNGSGRSYVVVGRGDRLFSDRFESE